MPPFHGENRVSIPLGRANQINGLSILPTLSGRVYGKSTENMPPNWCVQWRTIGAGHLQRGVHRLIESRPAGARDGTRLGDGVPQARIAVTMRAGHMFAADRESWGRSFRKRHDLL